MNVIQSEFIVRGFKNTNCYYIVKKENKNFDVYQLFCEQNKHIGVKELKSALPYLKNLSDSDVIVSIPNEDFNAFMLMNDVDMLEMNGFRITLNREEILAN